MDCIDACRQGAVGYRFRFAKTGAKPAVAFEAVDDTRKPDTARRSFLTGLGLLAASAAVRAQEKKVDGGLAVILDKKIPDRATPCRPARSPESPEYGGPLYRLPALRVGMSRRRIAAFGPSGDPDAARNVLNERGYCRPECAKCAEVCPTDAIRLTGLAEKSSIQIGHAVWVKENCVPLYGTGWIAATALAIVRREPLRWFRPIPIRRILRKSPL